MATEEAILADPTNLQFIEMLWDKGGYPLVFVIGLFALVWKLGWPKFGVSYSNPPPEPNAVVTALTALQEEVAEMRKEQDAFREHVEGDLRILLDRTPRK